MPPASTVLRDRLPPRSAECCECGIEFVVSYRSGRPPKCCPEHSAGYRNCSTCGRRCRPRQGNDLCSQCFESQCKQCGGKLSWPLRSYCDRACKAEYGRRGGITCQGCGEPIQSPAAQQRYCSVPCRRRTYRQLKPSIANGPRKARPWDEKRKANSQRRRALIYTTAVERIEPLKVFERDGWLCRICGSDVDSTLRHPHPMSASVDHMIALSRGGTHVWANVACSHLRCNLQKGDR